MGFRNTVLLDRGHDPITGGYNYTTVKDGKTLDGRDGPTPDPDAVPRELTPAEITETIETVPGSRIYCATGFSGGSFKNATGFGEIAANEALGKRSFQGLDFVRPERFSSSQPAS